MVRVGLAKKNPFSLPIFVGKEGKALQHGTKSDEKRNWYKSTRVATPANS
jgi:hypothetical protein